MRVYRTHEQEVCGLKWNKDGEYFASGGNDNRLFVYSPKIEQPLMAKRHRAAVKAIDWSHKNARLLVTGSGSKDRCIRLYNVTQNRLVRKVDTQSQICNILFSKVNNEVFSAHGFSQNRVCVWDEDLKPLQSLEGHQKRVLYLALNPDGNVLVSASGLGDETLRFWRLGYNQRQFSDFNSGLFQGVMLR